MQVKEMKFLSKKEVRKIEEIIEKNYGVKIDLSEYVVFKSGRREKIWIVSKDVFSVDLSKLRINAMGMYIGKLKRNDKIHLSIEFAQIIGKNAKKNVALVSKRQAERFVGGGDINFEKGINCEEHNFVLVKYKGYILGVGRLAEGKIDNLVPKSRKIISLR